MVKPNGPPPPPEDGCERTDKEVREWLGYLLEHYPYATLEECYATIVAECRSHS